MRWWLSMVTAAMACSTTPAPEAEPAPRKVPTMAKGSRKAPSAGRRGPDPLGTVGYGEANPACEDCSCRPSGVVASATREPFGTTQFDAKHLIDRNPSSVWCAGPSVTEPVSVTFTIPEDCALEAFRVMGGHFANRKALAEHGGATGLELAAGRRRGTANLEDPVESGKNLKQMITEPAVVNVDWPAGPDTLTVTFPRVRPGSVYPGLCLSELVPVLSGP